MIITGYALGAVRPATSLMVKSSKGHRLRKIVQALLDAYPQETAGAGEVKGRCHRCMFPRTGTVCGRTCGY